MIESYKQIVASQFDASLCMLNDCITQCPADHWDVKIAKYPYWQVVYHTLCYVDLYLSANNESFTPRAIHPDGSDELSNEYPSRRFSIEEMTEYLAVCRDKAAETINAETVETLQRESGFSWLPFQRVELHVYNIRHIMHHVGSLSASLRKVGAAPRWVGAGWKE